jgi:E3 ubiquitin-protein ligase ZSWIM2
MMKIFRISDSDPLLWQLSFLDSEISKILQNRYSGGGRRPTPEPPKDKKDDKKLHKTFAARMKLDEGEACCVCFEEMKEGTENLTYCKFGCGRNFHIDCVEVWVKNKLS